MAESVGCCQTFLFLGAGCSTFSLFFLRKAPMELGRHVLNNLKLIDMAFGCDVR
jgi:hypothetical protein